MRKILMICMVMVLGAAMCACGSESGSEAETDATETATEAIDISTAEIGPFEVTIKDYELIQDDEGKDAVFISFDFTNNSEENANFDTALYGQCFQNGVELDFGTIYLQEETTDPLYENKYKDIQSGASIEVKEVYLLQDKENPLTVQVVSMGEIMGGESEGMAEKVFEIAE